MGKEVKKRSYCMGKKRKKDERVWGKKGKVRLGSGEKGKVM